ncbi:hypothetical protein [Acetobacter sp.]|jgi:hypothetical protein|uniref:hypothetical protein n=1 Tax=Acetobacter sp. TaxID=440 RepID=UPI0039E9030F
MLLGKKNSACFRGLLLLAPLLAGCHHLIEGDDIDLPPERPGRFLPEAAPAEARAAQRDVERQEKLDAAQQAAGIKKPDTPPKPEDHYEVLPPMYDGGGSAGPMLTEDGHTITPQAQAVYGRSDNGQVQKSK